MGLREMWLGVFFSYHVADLSGSACPCEEDVFASSPREFGRGGTGAAEELADLDGVCGCKGSKCGHEDRGLEVHDVFEMEDSLALGLMVSRVEVLV